MTFWLVLAVNSVTFGGLLFLLSAGFSLIFGLMRIPNLTHGSLFMLGAYIGATFVIGILGAKVNFWVAALLAHWPNGCFCAASPVIRWRRCW
jgi:branched-chain amino acid transport system permease protein